MSDERLRKLERRWKETGDADDEARYLRALEFGTAAGDPASRATLLAERIRAGRCPWCGEAGAVHSFRRDDGTDYDAGCCCGPCFKEHAWSQSARFQQPLADRQTPNGICPGCPAVEWKATEPVEPAESVCVTCHGKGRVRRRPTVGDSYRPKFVVPGDEDLDIWADCPRCVQGLSVEPVKEETK